MVRPPFEFPFQPNPGPPSVTLATVVLGTERRTVKDKLTEAYVSLSDHNDFDEYSADGVNDFTSVINQAGAEGKPLFFPAGTYIVDEDELDSKLFRGFGFGSIQFVGSDNAYPLDPVNPQWIWARDQSGHKLYNQIFGGLGAGASCNPITMEWNYYSGLLAGTMHGEGSENLFLGPWVARYLTYAQDTWASGHGALQSADEVDRVLALAPNALKQAFSRTPWDRHHDYYDTVDIGIRQSRIWEIVAPDIGTGTADDYLYSTADGGVPPTYGVAGDPTTIIAAGRPRALFLPIAGSPQNYASAIIAIGRDSGIHLLRGIDSNLIGYKHGNGFQWINEYNGIGVSTFTETIKVIQVNAIGGQISSGATLFAQKSNLMGWGAARFVPSYTHFNVIGDEAAYYLGWDSDNNVPWATLTAPIDQDFQMSGVINGAGSIYKATSFDQSVAIGNFIGRDQTQRHVYFGDTLVGQRVLNEAVIPIGWLGTIGHRIVMGYYGAETGVGGGYLWFGDGDLRARAILSGDLSTGALVFGHNPWTGSAVTTLDRAADYQYQFWNSAGTRAILSIGDGGSTIISGTAAQFEALRLRETDAGAAGGPFLILDRISDSPVAADVLGAVKFLGSNSALAEIEYARISTVLVDPTAGSEDGYINFLTTIAGSAMTSRARIGNGLYTAGVSDMGLNTINATTLYQAGVALSSSFQPLDTTLTALAGITTAADKLLYASGVDTFATTDFSAFARTFLDDANAAAVISTLGLGALYQPIDSDLTSIAAVATTVYGRSFLAAADIPAARAILGRTDYVVSSDVTNSTTSAVNITGLAFTPTANKRYKITAILLGRADATTTGVRPGIATLPTGLTDFVSRWESSGAAVSNVSDAVMNTGPSAGVATAIPDTTTSWFYRFEGILIAGATPSGAFQLTITSEVAASVVTVKAGSWMSVEEY